MCTYMRSIRTTTKYLLRTGLEFPPEIIRGSVARVVRMPPEAPGMKQNSREQIIDGDSRYLSKCWCGRTRHLAFCELVLTEDLWTWSHNY